MKVSLFIPCYVDQFFPQIGISMIQVLERLGQQVDYPEGQTCCGQPAFNAGFLDEARSVAESFLENFKDSEAVVVPSGSCCAMVRVFYHELFADSPSRPQVEELASKIWEFSDFLISRLHTIDVGARFSGKVTIHDGCHGLRELQIKKQGRELLRHVRDLELVEMTEAETCCGFGGMFSVKFPQISTAMAEIKCLSACDSGAEYIASGDPSCLMQIQGYIDQHGLPLKTIHFAEILAQV